MSTLATVEPTSGKALVLTASDLTPAVAMDFKNAAQDFFVAKSVPADKQVSLILPGIKDIHVHDWIMADQARITSLTFIDFIKELHENYLQNDWEDQIRNDILTSTLASSKKSFWNWSQQLLSLNCLLRNTPSVFDDVALHNHLMTTSSKRKSNTVRPETTKSLRLGLLLYIYLMKHILPRTNINLTLLKECSNVKLNVR